MQMKMFRLLLFASIISLLWLPTSSDEAPLAPWMGELCSGSETREPIVIGPELVPSDDVEAAFVFDSSDEDFLPDDEASERLRKLLKDTPGWFKFFGGRASVLGKTLRPGDRVSLELQFLRSMRWLLGVPVALANATLLYILCATWSTHCSAPIWNWLCTIALLVTAQLSALVVVVLNTNEEGTPRLSPPLMLSWVVIRLGSVLLIFFSFAGTYFRWFGGDCPLESPLLHAAAYYVPVTSLGLCVLSCTTVMLATFAVSGYIMQHPELQQRAQVRRGPVR